MTWKEAVIAAINRFTINNHTRLIQRKALIDQELEQIIQDVGSKGKTPHQTLSKTLQELRDEEILSFDGNGTYLKLDTPLRIDDEDLPEIFIDMAIQDSKLVFRDIDTTEVVKQVRQRIGQDRLRQLTLENYGHQCALCDICDSSFLIASHIVRWADDENARGKLSNLICLCKFHDALFEIGYFFFTDDFRIIFADNMKGTMFSAVREQTLAFRKPRNVVPELGFIQRHRERIKTQGSAKI